MTDSEAHSDSKQLKAMFSNVKEGSETFWINHLRPLEHGVVKCAIDRHAEKSNELDRPQF